MKLAVVFLIGCSSSSNSGIATSTTERPATNDPATTTTTIASTTSFTLSTQCAIFADGVCPAGGVDPRLVCIPNCNGLDLSGLVAPGLSSWVSFEDADLTGADFSGAFVDGWSMQHANLTDARFVGANLLNVSFGRQDMVRVNFAGSTMYQTTFCEVDLTGAVFDGAMLESAVFTKTDLDGASFLGARTLTEEEYLANGASGTYGVYFYGTSVDDVVPSDDFGPTAAAESTSGVEPCTAD